MGIITRLFSHPRLSYWHSLHCLRYLRYLLFGLLLILAIAMTVARVFFLDVQNYKEALQDKIRELTELPVEIGHLRARMHGFNPEFIIDNMQVLAEDDTNNPAIKIRQIHLHINWLQLLWTQRILSSSQITLAGVELTIVREKDGGLMIVGLADSDTNTSYGFLNEGHYAILASHITWLDKQQKDVPVVFKNVNLLLKNNNNGQSHTFHLLSTLPKKYGKSLRISATMSGDILQKNMQGMVYVEGEDINFATLSKDNMLLDLSIQSGRSSFKAWNQVEHSKLVAVTGSMQAKDMMFANQRNKQQSLHIKQLQTAFNVVHKKDDWTLTVAGLSLETDDKKWTNTTFSVATQHKFKQITASILQLDLQALTRLTLFFMPADMAGYSTIEQLNLQGELKNTAVFIDRRNFSFAVNGLFRHIFVSAFGDFPAVENLSGHIKGNHQKGYAILNTDNGSVFPATLFIKPLAITKFRGEIAWLQTPKKWQITTPSLVLNTPYIDTETKLLINIPKTEKPIFVDLQTSFATLQGITHLSQYYPVHFMDKETLHWLNNAFISGEITRGDMLIYGEMDKFPFVEGQGVFEVACNMEDVSLQYNPMWPVVNHLDARVIFLKDGLTVALSRATTNHLSTQHIAIQIPSFTNSQHLLLSGEIEGKIIDGLRFLQQTPMHASADNILETITPTGLMQIDLDLKIPLTEYATTVANVDLHLAKAAIKVHAIETDITDITGDIKFTEQSLLAPHIRAKALGFPMQINARGDDLKTSINVASKVDIGQLQKQFGLDAHPLLKNQRLRGTTAYQLTLDLPLANHKPTLLKIKSDLAGIAIDLPESLQKSATDTASFTMTVTLNDETFLPISFNYADDLKATINVHKQSHALHTAHIAYGTEANIAPTNKRINIQIAQAAFSLSAWQKFIKQVQENAQTTEATNTTGTVAKTADNAAHLPANNIQIDLKTQQLYWQDKAFGEVELDVQRLSGQWQAHIISPAVKGKIILPNFSENEAIKLKLDFLNLTELMQLEAQGEEIGIQINTKDIPLFEVDSEQLWWQDVNLGSLGISMQRLTDGLYFKRLTLSSDSHDINSTARWLQTNGHHTTDIRGHIKVYDFGDFVAQFGATSDFKEGDGIIEFSAKWDDAPHQITLDTLKTDITLALENGRFLSIEPGAGRILGLLAVEQWAKRLKLDFGDIYKKGLSFNSIDGTFDIAQGQAHTQNLFINAVPAHIFVVGTANLMTKTLDYNVNVIPKNSAAIPIAGTIIGSIADIITKSLVDNYKKGYFFGSHYKVTGKWNDAKLTHLREQDGVLKRAWNELFN